MEESAPFSHLDARGQARMVDVSEKPATARRAVAQSFLALSPATVRRLRDATVAKGDALAVARVAAIQGAKRASDWVPLCHPVRLDHVGVDVFLETAGARIRVEARATDRTGVEMEALAGACAGALALYDMVKGQDRGASIRCVELLEKEGGRSGSWRRPPPGPPEEEPR
jgi:cyclic pyranopterin phosphate synthase